MSDWLGLSEHERLLIKRFVARERIERWKYLLPQEKGRAAFLHRLADPRDLRAERMIEIPRSQQTPDEILRVLKARGAPREAFVISEWKKLDRKCLDLSQAVELAYGIGLGTVISSIPGALCYYEGETLRDRWLLVWP